LRKNLITVFNDKAAEFVEQLSDNIKITGVADLLIHKPVITCSHVCEELVTKFSGTSLVPTLTFIDPCGYKGLSLELIRSVTKDFGCDCVFFFNYNRINMALENETVDENMIAVFGANGLEALRRKLNRVLGESQREVMIVEGLKQPLLGVGLEYILGYQVKHRSQKRTSHYIVFASKNFLGYDIMKDIMYKACSSVNAWNEKIGFDPSHRDYNYSLPLQLPKVDLQSQLLGNFKGVTLSFEDLYRQHTTSTPYVRKHYREALMDLERIGKLTMDPPYDKRPSRNGKKTLADHVLISFPSHTGSEE